MDMKSNESDDQPDVFFHVTKHPFVSSDDEGSQCSDAEDAPSWSKITQADYEKLPFPIGVHTISDFDEHEDVDLDSFTRNSLFSAYQSRQPNRAPKNPMTRFFLEELRPVRDHDGAVSSSHMFARFSGLDDYTGEVQMRLTFANAESLAGGVLYYVTRSKMMRPVGELCNCKFTLAQDLPIVSPIDCFCGRSVCDYTWAFDDNIDADNIDWSLCEDAGHELFMCKLCSRVYHSKCAESRREEDGSTVCLSCRPLEWGCHCQTLVHFEDTSKTANQWVLCEDCGRSCHVQCVSIALGPDGYHCKDEGKSCCTVNPFKSTYMSLV